MSSLLHERLFTLNEENLIINFNRELLSHFSNMRSHPDPFYQRWFSTYPYRKIGENVLYAENHFQIDFALGLSTLRIQANVKFEHGWWYDIDEWYSLHDGREYNKLMTLNDLLIIFKRHNVDTDILE